MSRDKKISWKVLVLIALVSSIAFCNGAYAKEQNKKMKEIHLERLDTVGSDDISRAEHKAGKQAKMDTNKDGSISKEERNIHKQKTKERKKKNKEVRKAREKALMDTDKDGSISKEERKYISRIEKKQTEKSRKLVRHVKKL